MIYQITGKVIIKEQDFVVLDLNGFGLKILSSMNTINNLSLNVEATLMTYLHVREDILDLYGFYSKIEKQIFLLLIGINGIGPKLAITIISNIDPEIFKKNIINSDIDALVAIPGIGTKTAKRIIIELKDKFTNNDDFSTLADDNHSILYADSLKGLLSLGYKSREVRSVLSNLLKTDDFNGDIEKIIKEALKELNS